MLNLLKFWYLNFIILREISWTCYNLIRVYYCYYEKISNNEPIIIDNIPYEIPNGWTICRLESIADIYTGNSINETEKVNKYTGLNAGYNYIATKDISYQHTINYSNGIKIPNDLHKFKKAYFGDVLLCIEGGNAGKKIALLEETVCFVNKLCAFHSLGINNKFLYYFLQSPQFTNLFKQNKSGLIGGVSINTIKSLLVLVPPIREQEIIIEKIESVFNIIN